VAGGARETVTVLHRFHFSSALKRMAALVRVRGARGVLDSRPPPRASRKRIAAAALGLALDPALA
jgi:magnesium-transporting ATPase (P-type)